MTDFGRYCPMTKRVINLFTGNDKHINSDCMEFSYLIQIIVSMGIFAALCFLGENSFQSIQKRKATPMIISLKRKS